MQTRRSRAERFAQGGDLGAVTGILSRQRDEILAQWLPITARQAFHAGRPGHVVADHIPALFDAIVAVLQRAAPRWIDPGPPLDDPAVLEAAQRDARARFEQGLQAADVLTEFRLLRQEIGRALRLHLVDDIPTSDVIATELLVHDALDGAMALGLAALGHELEELREEVLATTVHDVQQPITGLKGRLQLALRTLSPAQPDSERVANVIGQAIEQADRLSTLLDGLGAISRVALGRVEVRAVPADLRELIKTALDHLDPDTASRCRLAIPPAVVTTGVWDTRLLDRVFANLLSNAAKYSGMRAPIDVAVFNESDAVHLTVSDQGMGLTHEELGQLFQRYSRTRRVREQGTEGAGLGLYVCRGIVEAHGGHIWAESPGAGNGATFHVVLPRMPGQVAGE